MYMYTFVVERGKAQYIYILILYYCTGKKSYVHVHGNTCA